MSRRNYTIRRQRPVKGGRHPLPSCVLHSIAREVEKRAARYRVSKSFVIAVALADVFGVADQEHYLPQSKAEGG
jgi:hypothetical protein